MLKQKGFTPILLLVLAAAGIIIYLLVSSTFPFKDKLFSLLYPKPVSKATEVMTDSFEDPFLRDWGKTDTGYMNVISAEEAPTYIANVDPVDGSRILYISSDGTKSPYITRRFSSPQQGILSVYFYDPGPQTQGGTLFMVTNDAEDQLVILGVNPGVSNNYYYLATQGADSARFGIDTLISRKEGWRKFEIVVTPKGSYGKIDDVPLSHLPNSSYLTDIVTDELPYVTSVNANLTSFTKVRFAATGNVSGKYFYDNLKLQSLPQISSDIISREKYFLEKYLEIPPNYPGWSNPIDEGRIKGIRAATLAYLGQNTDEAKSLISDIAENFPLWMTESTSRQADGSAVPGSYWIGSFVSSSMGLAAWMLWPQLDTATRLKVKEALLTQAGKYVDLQPRSEVAPNTAVEENAAIADTLLLAALMFPQDPQAATFEAQGKKFAFHTLTRKGVNESYGDRITETVDENYLVTEHTLYPNPNYSLVGGVGMLGSAVRYYLRSGKEVPSYELGHNVSNVFDAHTNPSYLSSQTYRANFSDVGIFSANELGGKDDWAVDGTYLNSGFAYFGYLTGNTTPLLNLEEFELYITRDFLSFPQTGIEVYFPGCRASGVEAMAGRCQAINNSYYYSASGKYLINSVYAWSHLVAATIYDLSLSLPETVPPTVSITNPKNGTTVKKTSTVSIAATASDNVEVTKVEFYVAGSLLCTDTASPYNCSWSVPKQPRVSYSITAKAYDGAGNIGSSSNVTVTSK